MSAPSRSARGILPALRSATPGRLEDALNTAKSDSGHWAYTETSVDKDTKGGIKTVDPKFSPVAVSFHADASAAILFVKVGGTSEMTRTDFKRVSPCSDRFGVKAGPATADF